MKIRDIIESASVGGISAGAVAGGHVPSFAMQRRSPTKKKKRKKTSEAETLNPPSIDVGDEVKVGKFKNSKAEVKGFKKDEHGQPVLKTTKGDQKLYKPRVSKLEPGVKESNLNESSAYNVAKAFADQWNQESGVDDAQKLRVKEPGTRVWTRGDGTRHRDPGMILAEHDDTIAKFWKWLVQQPGIKPFGQISGEFGSDPYKPAVRLKNMFFVQGRSSVAYGSTSRVKNPNSVWRHKESVGENEVFPDVATPSAGQIARKHGVNPKQIFQQLKKGIQVEKEHTGDAKAAREIALDHLNEFPDYYDRLEGVEEGSRQDKLYQRYSKVTKKRTGKTPDEHAQGFEKEKKRIQNKLASMDKKTK